MLAPGMYLTGLEPSNCGMGGRAREREAGAVDVLAPSATRHYEVRLEAHVGAAAQAFGSEGTGERRDVTTSPSITAVDVMTIQAQLPAPVVFGEWIMHTREFALVRVRTDAGVEGYCYTLTRDGAVAEQIRKTIARIYVGSGDRRARAHIHDRLATEPRLACRGDRPAGVVDRGPGLLGRRRETRGPPHRGAPRRPQRPDAATAIIGYPPGTMGPEETGAQTAQLYAGGWRRFKAPIAATPERTAARLRAARAAAPDAWLGMDAAWVYDDVDAAAAFIESIPDVGLGWFEDVFPPGDAGILRRLGTASRRPIAQGDEQGGSYYPEALIAAGAVDVIRVDFTCMGGITGVAESSTRSSRPAWPSRRTCSRMSTAR